MVYVPWFGRNIGVELEMTEERTNGHELSAESIGRAIRQGVADVGGRGDWINDRDVGYYHSSGSTWDVKTDSSCGWEVASRILQLDVDGHNRELKAVCDRLDRLHPLITRSCGHHLHVDVSDLSWQEVQKLCWLWARYEPFFNELVEDSRRENDYCEPFCRAFWASEPSHYWAQIARSLSANTRDSFFSGSGSYPRGALNMQNWWRHGRIEIRLHHGTVDYEEIRGWAMLMLSLVSRVKQSRLPEIKPHAPGPRETGISTRYIWKALGLLPQRDHDEVHPNSEELYNHVIAKRQRLSGVEPLTNRNRIVHRLRMLRDETGGVRSPSFDTEFHRSMQSIDVALGNRPRNAAPVVDHIGNDLERLRALASAEPAADQVLSEYIVSMIERPYLTGGRIPSATSRRLRQAAMDLLAPDSGVSAAELMTLPHDHILDRASQLAERRAQAAQRQERIRVEQQEFIVGTPEFYIIPSEPL